MRRTRFIHALLWLSLLAGCATKVPVEEYLHSIEAEKRLEEGLWAITSTTKMRFFWLFEEKTTEDNFYCFPERVRDFLFLPNPDPGSCEELKYMYVSGNSVEWSIDCSNFLIRGMHGRFNFLTSRRYEGEVSGSGFGFNMLFDVNNQIEGRRIGNCNDYKLINNNFFFVGTILDTETGQQDNKELRSDLGWQRCPLTSNHVNKKCLTPLNGTKLKIIHDVGFDEIDDTYIASLVTEDVPRQNLFTEDDLQVGTIFIFETEEGHYGKIQVLNLYSLHDFSFEGAQQLKHDWRKKALACPDEGKYYLQVIWRLYK